MSGPAPWAFPPAWAGLMTEHVLWLEAAGRSAGAIRLRRLYVARLGRVCPDPAAVTAAAVAGFLAAGTWAPETRRSARANRRGFAAWAVRFGHWATDPTVDLLPVAVPPGVPRPAGEAAILAAFDRADARVRLMLLLGALAGLRRAEIAGLHRDHVVGDVLRVRGKGGRTREIPVHPQLAAELALSLEPGWFFPNRQGGHLSAGHVGKLLTEVLPAGVTPHQLRHAFASAAFAADRDLRAVQELLGHSSVATTQRYTQVPDDAKRAAVHGIRGLGWSS